jgi:glycosyltransferase involved in cell wall biosynthesis
MTTATKDSERAAANPSIAILVPCHNEELTVAEVVRQFKTQLPDAVIYVFDNRSSDRTTEKALEAGAVVATENRLGKGYVVQAMFEQIDADVYVLVDGDATYPAADVHGLLRPVLRGEADMVVGSRLHDESQSEFRWSNRLGNRIFLRVVNWIFNVRLTDILSGYRVFSRRFVKTVPLFSPGFEIETELTIKALDRGFRVVEVPVNLINRPQGSHSKIRHMRDGYLILSTIFGLFRDYRPLTFFGSAGLAFIAVALIPGTGVILDYWRTGLVPRLPSAILAVAFVLAGMLLGMIGLILNTTVGRFRELNYQLRILSNELGVGPQGMRNQSEATRASVDR